MPRKAVIAVCWFTLSACASDAASPAAYGEQPEGECGTFHSVSMCSGACCASFSYDDPCLIGSDNISATHTGETLTDSFSYRCDVNAELATELKAVITTAASSATTGRTTSDMSGNCEIALKSSMYVDYSHEADTLWVELDVPEARAVFGELACRLLALCVRDPGDACLPQSD